MVNFDFDVLDGERGRIVKRRPTSDERNDNADADEYANEIAPRVLLGALTSLGAADVADATRLELHAVACLALDALLRRFRRCTL